MNNTKGNALFIILIAVALFAALTYAITYSSRSSGNIQRERDDIKASLLVSYINPINIELAKKHLLFNIPYYAFDYRGRSMVLSGNTNCTRSECKVFTSRGGDLNDLPLAKSLRDTFAAADWSDPNRLLIRINYAYVKDIGTSNPDVLFTVQGISDGICRAVNRLAFNSDTIPEFPYGGNLATISGNMTNFPVPHTAIIGNTVDSAALAGQMQGCYYRSNTSDNFYYMTLQAR